TAALIITRLTDKIRKQKEHEQKLEEKIVEAQQSMQDKSSLSNKTDSGGTVEGVDNELVRLSRCCNPVPNDEIVGYITKGRGVSVHRKDCPNVQTNEAKERFLEVRWKNARFSDKEYYLDLEMSGYDRHGLLNEVLQVVNETNTQISSVS